MNYVGTTPSPPRALPASAPVAVAPAPIDRAAGEAPRREQSSAEQHSETTTPQKTTPAEPAIKIAGALTALFAGEVVEVLVEQPPAGWRMALHLPEGRLVALESSDDSPGDSVRIRLVRTGNEPTIELLGSDGKSRTPPLVVKVRLEQSIVPVNALTAARLPIMPPVPSEEPGLTPSGIVPLPAMMGRVAVHVPANAAYLHTASELPDASPPIDPLTMAESELVPPRLGADWDALWTALEAHPAVADRVRDLLPAYAPARLAGGFLFLANVLRHGTLRQWLGDEVFSRLAATSPQNFGRAQSAFDDLSRQARDPGSEGWRTIPLALVQASVVQPVMLYVHRPPRRRKTDPGPADGATRFMVDLVLSAAGPLRIDGLYRQKLLDLIVRTERSVPRVISGELRTLYADALAASGLSGRLEFQTVPRLPPAPVARPQMSRATLTA